jgi:hypothetical protein
VIPLYVKLPSTFLIFHFIEDWKDDNVATVTNKRKVLSVEEKVKVIRGVVDGKKGG